MKMAAKAMRVLLFKPSEDPISESRKRMLGELGVRRFRQTISGEANALEFRWRPTVVVACTALALMLPWYHGGEHGFVSLLNGIGGAGFSSACQRFGINFALVIQLGLPLIAIFSMRQRPTEFGLGLGDVKLGIKLCLLFYVLYIPCFIVLFANGGFQEYYSGIMRRYATWSQFLLVESVSLFFLSLRTEFLYRGFLLFGIKKEYGPYAGVLIQLLPYVLVHVGKAELEALGSLPVGLALGYLAARTGSIWYGAVLHGSIAFLFNALILLVYLHNH